MAANFKTGGAMGSALPDPVKDSAALAPIPAPAIENKPAPGQLGPKGMAPRTTYSRVNTGLPPVMDAGAQAQKSGPPRGLEFLPAKVASSRGPMTTKERPLLQDMLKAAMAGTSQRLAINIEAVKQAANRSVTKTASAVPTNSSGHVSTEFATKLASALGFIGDQLRKQADLGPGEGPNALRVMEATSSETNIDAGESGQATSKNQPPQTPSLQPDKAQVGNAGTGLATNDDTTHPEQPVSPVKNASVKLADSNLERVLGLLKKASVTVHLKEVVKSGSAPIQLIRKLAEDAINPAHIQSPANVDPAKPPPGASASGEDQPSEPADVNSQKNLISSNEAAINYTKGQAKADPKKDVNQLLSEPALSSSTDKVLERTLDNTGQAGVKISSAKSMSKTAAQVGAQRVLLSRLLEKAANEGCDDKKEPGKDKKSMGMAPTTPQAATGANAATMGM